MTSAIVKSTCWKFVVFNTKAQTMDEWLVSSETGNNDTLLLSFLCTENLHSIPIEYLYTYVAWQFIVFFFLLAAKKAKQMPKCSRIHFPFRQIFLFIFYFLFVWFWWVRLKSPRCFAYFDHFLWFSEINNSLI